MNELTSVQILIGFYLATVIVNIVVSSLQIYVHQTRVSKLIFSYWVMILISAFLNGFFKEMTFFVLLISSSSNVISQSIMGVLLAEVTSVKIRWKGVWILSLILVLLGAVLFEMRLPFEIAAIPFVLFSSYPFLYASYFILKEKKRAFTLAQKMFFFAAILMSLHYLDYPYFRPRPELFIIGLTIAFSFYHVLSIFMPMLANEHSLEIRNQKLEEEVAKRVELLHVANKEIWESNKRASFGRMAGTLAHEFNNPLTALLMNIERMRDEDFSKNEISDIASRFESSSKQIFKITENLRRISSDQLELEKENFWLVTKLEDLITEFSKTAENFGVTVNYTPSREDYLLNGNLFDFKAAIMNLLSNALDAVLKLEKKEIAIYFIDDYPRISLFIKDSGQIPTNVASHLFDPFFTTKKIGEGTGLGLYTALAIIEKHGGSLTLDPSSASTCFKITLPVQDKRNLRR